MSNLKYKLNIRIHDLKLIAANASLINLINLIIRLNFLIN